MLLTPHTAAGIAIASVLPDPQIAIPLSFFSHFILDFIPHWDRIGLGLLEEKFRPLSPKSFPFQFILLDALLSLTISLFFFNRVLPDYGLGVTILFSAFAANLPDLFYVPLAFFGKRWGWGIWMIKLQHTIQTHSKAPLPFGILTQAVAVTICLLIALR